MEIECLEDFNFFVRLIIFNIIVLVVCGGYGVSCLLVDIDW